MSSYVPLNWVDGSTPLNEANLDHMEQGIDAAMDLALALDALPKIPTPLEEGEWLTVSGGAMVWAPAPAGGGGGGLDWEGAWAAGTAYVKGDVVTKDGVVYGAVNDSTGQTPPAYQSPTVAVNPVPLVTALPASPFDGQEIILVDSLTAPTYQWRLRYVAAKATNKWVLAGGGGYIKAEENTTEPTYTSFSWVDLGPPNVSVTVPVTGLWAIEFLATLTAAAASTRYIAVKLGAAATQQADGIVTTTSPHGNMRYLERQLSAGDVLKFQVQTSASTITVRIPFWLRIRPVAVGG